jgi:hypothetical protein
MLPGRQISGDAGKHGAKPSAHDPADAAGLWLSVEQGIDVTGAVDHADDLDGVVDQLMEDDVVLNRQATQARSDCPDVRDR